MRSRSVVLLLDRTCGILPGIGGSFTRFGHVEVRYVTELLGLSLIFAGYLLITRDGGRTIHRVAEQAA